MVTAVITATRRTISQLDHDATTAVDNLLCGERETRRRNFPPAATVLIVIVKSDCTTLIVLLEILLQLSTYGTAGKLNFLEVEQLTSPSYLKLIFIRIIIQGSLDLWLFGKLILLAATSLSVSM